MTPVFKWSGEYFGFIHNENLFHANGAYFGWIEDGQAWSSDGAYLGDSSITEDPKKPAESSHSTDSRNEALWTNAEKRLGGRARGS